MITSNVTQYAGCASHMLPHEVTLQKRATTSVTAAAMIGHQRNGWRPVGAGVTGSSIRTMVGQRGAAT